MDRQFEDIKELRELVYKSEINIASLIEHQKSVDEKVDKIATSIEKLLISQTNIQVLSNDCERMKGIIKDHSLRLKKIEDHVLMGNSWKRLLAQWWKLPVAATIVTTFFELGKRGFKI